MQMHVVVGVHVIQGKSCLLKRLKLGTDLGLKLPPDSGPEEEVESGSYKMRGEFALCIHEVRQLRGRQYRFPLHQHQMEAHPQRRQVSRPLYGVLGGARTYHQTRCSQDAALVCFDDGLVYWDGKAEIIPGDDDSPHGPVSFDTSRPSRVTRNSVPRHTVVRFIKESNQEIRDVRSRGNR